MSSLPRSCRTSDTLLQARAPRLPVRSQRGEELDRGPGTHDALVVERAGLQPIGRGGRRGRELRGIERIEQRLSSPQHPDVRAVELVGRAGEEIAVPGTHVRHVVRGVVHAVDEYQCPDGVRQRGQLRHVVHGAERVGGCAHGEQPHPVGQLARQHPPRRGARPRVACESPAPRVHARGPARRQVSELAWWSSSVTTTTSPARHPLAERASQVKGQRRHVGAEDDLLGRAAEPVGQRARGRRAVAASVSWLVG